MKNYELKFICIVIVGLIACSSISVKHDYDPAVDFSKYKTYELYEKAIKGDALSKNPLVKKRVLVSLDKVLKENGYKQAEEGKANFVVVAQAGIKERMQVTNWGGYGWYRPGWGAYGSHTDVSYYEEGNLVINVIDTKKKELAWRGVATGTLKESSGSEEMQERLDYIIAKILKNFPPSK